MNSLSAIRLKEDIDIRELDVKVFETSASGNRLKEIHQFNSNDSDTIIELFPKKIYQTITGFGGSFSKASAYLLNLMSGGKREEILEAYFGEEGARYSLTRTHINSCDFSPFQYSYALVAGDIGLDHFSIEEDKKDLIPMIRAAQAISQQGFRIISSPWTAPPWMKNNNDWVGGKLLPEYYSVWAKYFTKYLDAYKTEGIDIWGVTVENEPLGNGNNWESMHYTPEEMTDFVRNYLGPVLQEAGKGHVKIFGFDQNREELKEWVDAMYDEKGESQYFSGTAIHWYGSTVDYFPENLQYAHKRSPEKHLIQTEACIDAEVPRWKDDDWYWSNEATDWGWDWAPEDKKWRHPRYTPVYRYAADIIGCLNNWVDGWIDWNMVLDRQGGPNRARNWCIAPVIVDTQQDEIYYSPLYYVLSHFSKYIRPGAKRINFKYKGRSLQMTGAKNADGSLVVIILNNTDQSQSFSLKLGNLLKTVSIQGQAIQTILVTT
ncbi:MAG: glycoside hydrolase family 30 beta sandwich domain-containing protein [Bacteroidota bacterium]